MEMLIHLATGGGKSKFGLFIKEMLIHLAVGGVISRISIFTKEMLILFALFTMTNTSKLRSAGRLAGPGLPGSRRP